MDKIDLVTFFKGLGYLMLLLVGGGGLFGFFGVLAKVWFDRRSKEESAFWTSQGQDLKSYRAEARQYIKLYNEKCIENASLRSDLKRIRHQRSFFYRVARKRGARLEEIGLAAEISEDLSDADEAISGVLPAEEDGDD